MARGEVAAFAWGSEEEAEGRRAERGRWEDPTIGLEVEGGTGEGGRDGKGGGLAVVYEQRDVRVLLDIQRLTTLLIGRHDYDRAATSGICCGSAFSSRRLRTPSISQLLLLRLLCLPYYWDPPVKRIPWQIRVVHQADVRYPACTARCQVQEPRVLEALHHLWRQSRRRLLVWRR